MILKPTRIALALAALSLPFAAVTASANQSLVSPGHAGTLGSATNPGSVQSSLRNPAVNTLLLKDGQRFRYGYMSNLGGYIELGSVEDLDVIIENLEDDLDAVDEFDETGIVSQHLLNRYSELTATSTEADIYEAIALKANEELVPALEKGGQVRFGGLVQLPLTPFVFSSEQAKGVFSVNASASLQGRGAFMGSPFKVKTTYGDYGNIEINIGSDASGALKEIENLNEDNATFDDIKDILDKYDLLTTENEKTLDAIAADGAVNNIGDVTSESELVTDSGVDLKLARVTHLALGYGTSLNDWADIQLPRGELELGTRLNLYQVEMMRGFASLKDDDDDNTDYNDEPQDNSKKSTAVALDVGVLWHDDNFSAGLTIYNLNEPSFDYPDLGKYLNPTDLEAAEGLQGAGKMKLKDSVTLTRHAVIEGAYYSRSRNWMLQGYYTLGTATNFVGDEFQNMGVSAGYYTDSWLIPGGRIGYNKNLAGTELGTINVGGTFFGIMNLDVAFSTESNSYDGTSMPRYLAFNLGFEQKF